jgi:hypothetical protein
MSGGCQRPHTTLAVLCMYNRTRDLEKAPLQPAAVKARRFCACACACSWPRLRGSPAHRQGCNKAPDQLSPCVQHHGKAQNPGEDMCEWVMYTIRQQALRNLESASAQSPCACRSLQWRALRHTSLTDAQDMAIQSASQFTWLRSSNSRQ